VAWDVKLVRNLRQISGLFATPRYGAPAGGRHLSTILPETGRGREFKNSPLLHNTCQPMIEVTYNVLDPAQMTERERQQEVAQILAYGIVRLCNQASKEVEKKKQIQLAMPGEKSVHTLPKNALLRAAQLLRKSNGNNKAIKTNETT
jgi:hypothetical protein